jgi:hypothetical protein
MKKLKVMTMSLFVIGCLGSLIIYGFLNHEEYVAFLVILLSAMAPQVLLEVFNFPFQVRDGYVFWPVLRIVIFYTIFCVISEPVLHGVSFLTSSLIRVAPVIFIYIMGAFCDYKKNKLKIMTPKVKK